MFSTDLLGWISEISGNILNLLQKEGVPRKDGGVPSEIGRGLQTLEETMMYILMYMYAYK